MARKVKKMSNKRYFDYSLLFVIIFIVGFGLVMIYSTSSYTAQMEYGSSEYYFKKQLIFDVYYVPVRLPCFKENRTGVFCTVAVIDSGADSVW